MRSDFFPSRRFPSTLHLPFRLWSAWRVARNSFRWPHESILFRLQEPFHMPVVLILPYTFYRPQRHYSIFWSTVSSVDANWFFDPFFKKISLYLHYVCEAIYLLLERLLGSYPEAWCFGALSLLESWSERYCSSNSLSKRANPGTEAIHLWNPVGFSVRPTAPPEQKKKDRMSNFITHHAIVDAENSVTLNVVGYSTAFWICNIIC